jgi:hypothetical protein
MASKLLKLLPLVNTWAELLLLLKLLLLKLLLLKLLLLKLLLLLLKLLLLKLVLLKLLLLLVNTWAKLLQRRIGHGFVRPGADLMNQFRP